MQIEIKNRYTGEVMHSGEWADLRTAVIYLVKEGKSLRSADLRSADLQYADLQYANLQYADLQSADLQSANLQYANLQSANLQYANLRSANLQYADLQYANLQYANLQYANLRSANLQYANLRSANLRSATNAELPMAMTVIAPEGELSVWKKCQNKVLVRLRIPADARRSNASGRKCRAEFVDVLEVIGAEQGVSIHASATVYRVGERVVCDKWNEDRWTECGGGIHFFLTREEAEAYTG